MFFAQTILLLFIYESIYLSDVKLTKDGYRISFPQPKNKPKAVIGCLIQVGTLEYEIFHCFLSTIHKELNLKPGEKLWQTGKEATKTKRSHFTHSPMGEKKVRAIARYVADKLGYDAIPDLEFKLHSFCLKDESKNDASIDKRSGLSQDVKTNENKKQNFDNSSGHRAYGESSDSVNPCSSNSLEEKGNVNNDIASDYINSDDEDFDNVQQNILDSDADFVDPETKKSSNDAFDLDEWIKGLGTIECLGIDPYALESSPTFQKYYTATKEDYKRSWFKFLKLNNIRVGHPPTFAQLWNFLEMKYKKGQRTTTVGIHHSILNLGLQEIYNRKLTYWTEISK